MNKDKLIKFFKNIAAVMLLISLLAIVYYQNRDKEIFRRDVQITDNSEKNSDVYDGYTAGDIAKVGGDILFVTSTSYSIVKPNGNVKTKEAALSDPVVYAEGDYAIYYNKADKEAFVLKHDKPRYTVISDNRIIKAKVTDEGYSIVVTEKEGYTSEIIVYDAIGDAVFKWDISESEFLDADVDPINSHIVVSTTNVKDGKLSGIVMLIDMTEAKIQKKKNFKSELFYNVKINKNGTYTALGSDSLAYFNRNGTLKWSLGYGNDYLIKADISTPDKILLAFSAPGSGIKGNSSLLRLVDRLGKVYAETTLNGTAEDVKVNGSLCGVAVGKNVYLLNDRLETEKTLVSKSSIKKVSFFGDGKHLFVLSNSGGEIIK